MIDYYVCSGNLKRKIEAESPETAALALVAVDKDNTELGGVVVVSTTKIGDFQTAGNETYFETSTLLARLGPRLVENNDPECEEGNSERQD